MTYTRTLAQLRTAFLQLGGFESSIDITEAVSLQYLNDALEETYGLVVACGDDFHVKLGTSFPLVVGTDTYAWPTDFYNLRKVEIQRGTNDWQKLLPVSIDGANRVNATSVRGLRYRYRPTIAGLVISPVPTSTESIRIYYLPLATQLAADSDVVTFDRPVEQKLVIHIALRDALLRSDLDTSAMEAKIASLSKQLRTAADSHDIGEPFYLNDRVIDDDEDCY